MVHKNCGWLAEGILFIRWIIECGVILAILKGGEDWGTASKEKTKLWLIAYTEEHKISPVPPEIMIGQNFTKRILCECVLDEKNSSYSKKIIQL